MQKLTDNTLPDSHKGDERRDSGVFIRHRKPLGSYFDWHKGDKRRVSGEFVRLRKPLGYYLGACLYDLIQMETSLNSCQRPNECNSHGSDKGDDRRDSEEFLRHRKPLGSFLGPQCRLESLLCEGGNKFCADCGSPDPKWVSLSTGAFICIKCSGIHRSLGVHISKVLSVKLDEWTEEQVDTLIELGGNNAVNLKYEANIPNNHRKPKPDSSIEERADFIKRKYEKQQFLNQDLQLSCPFPSQTSCNNNSSSCDFHSSPEKKNSEKQSCGRIIFRSSWKKPEYKTTKKTKSMAGMVEFVGLIKVNIVRGTNLAIRDMVSSDPYVILSLGNQSMKTRVIKNNLNPVWNESLMLSIPENIPPLKLLVFDKDTFTTDDFMGEAEIDIRPLFSAAKDSECSSSSIITESTHLGKWKASEDNALVSDGIITLEDGKVKQEITIKLQKVERGVLDIELECVPLTQ